MNSKDKQELEPPAGPCPPSKAVSDSTGGFLLCVHQQEASLETTEQHPRDPVLTITAPRVKPGGMQSSEPGTSQGGPWLGFAVLLMRGQLLGW